METKPTVFLAWSSEVSDGDTLALALKTVRDRLNHRGYRLHDWSLHPDIKNIGTKVQELIRDSDLVFLEASTNRANIAFEAGLATGLRIPQVVLKQAGTGQLPEDYGSPEYLDYPADVTDDVGFRAFRVALETLLDELELTVLNSSQRAARSSRLLLDKRVAEFCAAYPSDHPFPYLLSGRLDAFAQELRDGGTAKLITDSDYYEPSFDKLRFWDGGRIRAIADLTDDTEQFWMAEHPDSMSAHVSERIFLVDWKLFFDGGDRLDAYIEGWRRHLERYRRGERGSEYKIYVATRNEEDKPHPGSWPAIGQHLLVMEPDSIGGYSRKDDTLRRMFVSEQNTRKYERAMEYYGVIRDRSVLFDPDYSVADLKREWLRINKLGYWNPSWSGVTEARETPYFTHYDKHIRCWVPSYDQMLRDTAGLVELEILRIWGLIHRPLNLLELGYGTGNLTTGLVQWIRSFHEAFTQSGAEPPVGRYLGLDRAPRMVRQAHDAIRNGTRQLMPDLRRGRIWSDLSTTQKHDVIFGTLILHFLLGTGPSQEKMDDFFVQCARRLTENGAIVVADVFRPESGEAGWQARDHWRSWMIGNGTSEQYADAYLAGNADMIEAATVAEFIEAGERNGFRCETSKPIGDQDQDLPFYVFCFHRVAASS